jgi:RHS repeat protein
MGNKAYEQRDSSLADGFGYNLNNELTSFRRDGTLSGSTVSAGTLNTLVYDASGNRTSLVEGGATTTYTAANNLNQYPTVGGAAATYDANGNLKTYNGSTYTYDAMNRLTQASKGTTTVYLRYDEAKRVRAKY